MVKLNMLPFPNGDYLRLPFKIEICGINGKPMWEIMNDLKERAATKSIYNLHDNDKYEYFTEYWLQDIEGNSFNIIRSDGSCAAIYASNYSGVRLVFKLKNK